MWTLFFSILSLYSFTQTIFGETANMTTTTSTIDLDLKAEKFYRLHGQNGRNGHTRNSMCGDNTNGLSMPKKWCVRLADDQECLR